MTQKVKKAIIAVAGSGTRLLPATKSMPKEMLPIVDKPIIQLIAEELSEAGVEDMIMVTKWDKKPLEDHFDHSTALEQDLEKAGKDNYLEEIKKVAELANFIYVRQKPYYGNGVPIISAASLVDDEPFVFCFGDDLVKSKTSFTKQMVTEFEKTGSPIIGVQKVPKDQVCKYGVVKLKEGTMEVEDIIEKPTVEDAPSDLVAFGRMILNQEIIDILKETPEGKGGEIWIVDALRTYVKNGGKLIAKAVEDGEWMTTGDPLNYTKTILAYAFEREDIGEKIKDYINTELCKK